MKTRLLSRFVVATALAAGLAMADTPSGPNQPQSDEQIAKTVRHDVLMYPYYTIWDDVAYQVNNGQVVLTGAVTEPVKKSDLGRIMQRIPGVTSVTNNLEVLPLSPMDNQLRFQVARAIFSYPTLSRYSMGALPSIHIIVDNGHVTLTGVVDTAADKQIAGMRASGAGLGFGPVVNNLQVVRPGKKS
jgi:hyperosmotically inducible protein